MSNTDTLTKEQLLACLEHDGVEVDAATIKKAKRNDGIALYDIGQAYKTQKKNYSKAIAWYRLAANQNNLFAYNNIGAFYANGYGVSRDYDIAMDCFLKAAGANCNIAMGNIGVQFLKRQGVPLDEYKALEWFIKSGNRPEQVEKLNEEGFHLKEEDKKKTVHQLIIETENIIREERKKEEECVKLMESKLSNEKELTNLRKDNQKLQHESQQKQQRIDALENKEQQGINEREISTQANNTLKQQLKDKEEIINSLKREIEASKKESKLFELLVQSKNNEIDLLKKDNQRLGNLEQENHDLKRKLEAHQESASSMVNNNSTNTSSNNDTTNNITRHNAINDSNVRVKIEENELLPCEILNKKRKVT